MYLEVFWKTDAISMEWPREALGDQLIVAVLNIHVCSLLNQKCDYVHLAELKSNLKIVLVYFL